jgi:hypothetical protein
MLNSRNGVSGAIWLVVTVTVLTVMFGTVAACDAAKPGKSGAGNSKPGSTDPLEQGRRFAQCMRDHGVDVPDPGSGGGVGVGRNSPAPGASLDPNSPTVKAAIEACKSLDPNGGEAPPPIDPTQLAQMRDYSKCMRDHGVDMADPNPNGGPRPPKTANADAAVEKAAGEACKDKLPGGVENGGPGR